MSNLFTRFLVLFIFGLSSKWYKAFTTKRIVLETRHGNQEIVGDRAIFYGFLYLFLQAAIFYIVIAASIKELLPILRTWMNT
jgi:hypothetical protein